MTRWVCSIYKQFGVMITDHGVELDEKVNKEEKMMSVQSQSVQNNVWFAAKLSHQMSKEDPNGNFVFSPVSLEIVVAPILGGTGGNTNRQIKRHIFNKIDRDIINYIESLKNSLETRKTKGATLKYTMVLAVDDKFPVRKQFKRQTGKMFPSGKLLQGNVVWPNLMCFTRNTQGGFVC
uniref:Serpin domain-containing protein n=1 Tax=Romanomermis culicivorax TaxID=13658 RepID=A0A915JGS3_ROMCU